MINKFQRYSLPLTVLVFAFAYLLLAAPHAHAATNYYASPADQGLGDCSSAGNACDLLQALTAAFNNTTDSTVMMSAGTYAGFFSFDTSFGHVFTLTGAGNDVTIIEPTGSTGMEIGTLSTISINDVAFDNNADGRGLTIDSEGSLTVNDCVFSGNAGGGLIDTHFANTGSVSIINDTFTNNSSSGDGAAFSFTDNGTTAAMPITVWDTDFENNTSTGGSGGAISIGSNSNSSPVLIRSNNFSGNTAANIGGAVYAFTTGTNSGITLGDGGLGHDNTITDNTAHVDAGGFYIDTDGDGSPVTIENNTVGTTGHGNSSGDFGGGGKVFAGSGLTLIGNTFTDNTAGGNAGGLGVLIDRDDGNTSDNSIANNTFTNNTAHFDGGGLNLSVSYAGNLTVDANTFTNNTATTGEGGGFRLQQFASSSQVVVTNNLLVNNTSGTESGGFDYYDQSSAGLDFINNTVADNIAGNKVGGANFGVDNITADLNIYNNIFWGNTSNSAHDVHIDHFNFDVTKFYNNDSFDFCLHVEALDEDSCFDSTGMAPNFNGDAGVNGVYDLGRGNIKDDPEFTDADNGDYTLTEFSPALDSGLDTAPNLPGHDITGNGRIQHTHADMGAYELIIPAQDLVPYVLTAITPIPDHVDGTTATYTFSATGTGEAEYVAQTCGGSSQASMTEITDHPEAQQFIVTNLTPGQTYSCNFEVLSIAGYSNQLDVGPFTVNDNGAVPVQFLIDQTRATAHPDGTLVLDGQTVYLIKDGKRYGFRDPSEYESYGYNFSQVVPANDSDIRLGFDPANIMKAMPGTLVLDKSDGRTVYMIGENYTKRGFVSSAVFKDLGYTFKNLPTIDLSDYPTGPAVDSATDAHPEGSLVLDSKTVWWILNGVKLGFESMTVFNTYGFSLNRVVKADSSDLELPTGNLIPLRDGTLVLDGGNYYIISDGAKRQFATPAALSNWGYKSGNAVNTTISSYLDGQLIN
ncbi:MAG TPA: right-handed parallel beta-helix repeat-containing protein [Patescibacteria group bacterium]|nr:right-handed parallel beta-helix repeat-containing protein [Patescibacteria group bacterium]